MSFPPAKSTGKLDEKQRAALISLLADDDVAVFRTVRQKLLSFGPIAVQWLKPYSLCNDPVLRRRALEIVKHFSRLDADTQFLAFCLSQGEDFDLEQGVLLLARTQYPDINMEGYNAILDSFAADLRMRLDVTRGAEHLLGGIAEYLFVDQGFVGDETHGYDPENSFLNRVVDRRKGNPISLSVVYLLVTRRLRLPVSGIGLPGHFLCRYQTSISEIYIDPFNKGKLKTKSDCVRQVVQLRHRFDESCLAPVSSRRILLRICANLHQIYTHIKSPAQAERLQRYLVALAK